VSTVNASSQPAPAQVVHRARRAAALAGYHCPDCGADHPLNGRMDCATCRRIHEEAAGHSSDVLAEMSDKRGHVVDPEVAKRSPELAHDLKVYADRRAASAYAWAACQMAERRARYLAGRLVRVGVAA